MITDLQKVMIVTIFLWQETGKQKVRNWTELNWTFASIPPIQSILPFFVNFFIF
jgi:hypothetical protein